MSDVHSYSGPFKQQAMAVEGILAEGTLTHTVEPPYSRHQWDLAVHLSFIERCP